MKLSARKGNKGGTYVKQNLISSKGRKEYTLENTHDFNN